MKRLLEPLKRRVLLSISRAVITMIRDDVGIQTAQVELLAGEVQDGVERFQNYGFTSHPPDQSEGVALFPGGDRSHGLLIAVDSRLYRLKGLAKGEVALYSDEGDSIILKRGNTIEVNTSTLTVNAANSVTVNTPMAEFSNDVKIDGKLDVVGNITSTANIADLGGVEGTMQDIRDVYNTHTHNENGDGGGVTDPPNQPL